MGIIISSGSSIPGDGTVSTAKIVDGAVTVPKADIWETARIFVPTLEAMTVTAGTWAEGFDAGHMFLHRVYNSTSADADRFTFQIPLKAGTYTVTGNFQTNNSSGICTIDFGGTDVGTEDLYAAGSTTNNWIPFAGCTLAADGMVTVGVRCNGKHASSSNYVIMFHAFVFEKTA